MPDFDVVILGGAFSGASAAILLRRELPQLRVAVIEKASAFDARVGEATTEMSAMFLTRRLALWQHLEAEHLPKEGLRYWFTNEKVTGHANASEAGGWIRSAVPAFQLRRDVFDEHLLATASAEGAEVLRPAKVVDVRVGEFDHTVTLESGRAITCRWLLDASGRVNLVGRRLGIIERNEDHPIAAIWCRWSGVRHIDDLAARDGELARTNIGSRRLGTNHYTGRGYWIWVIPLGNGETSIGVVFDKRLVDIRREDFAAFLKANPALRELLEGAAPRLDDVRFYSHLPYVTRRFAGPGWALLGDAAAFLDPYYSPGLDHAAFTVEAAVNLIAADAGGEDVGPMVVEHNETFIRSYDRFFRAVYRDKYFYMGEADLLSAAFLLDTAHYYIFVVIPAYRLMKRFSWMPVLGPKPAFFSYHLMAFYNRRFRTLAENRRARGEEGRRNDGRRITAYFNLHFAPLRMAIRGVKLWAVAELDNVRLQFKRAVRAAPAPIAGSSPARPPESAR